MPSRRARSLARKAQHIPILRQLPAARMLALAEVALVARDHLQRLDPHERRRLVELVRTGRGRRRNLSSSEQRELSRLVGKLQPRELAGRTVEAVSPVRLPRRLLYGRGRSS